MKRCICSSFCSAMGIFTLVASFCIFLISGFKKKSMLKASLLLLSTASAFIINNIDEDK